MMLFIWAALAHHALAARPTNGHTDLKNEGDIAFGLQVCADRRVVPNSDDLQIFVYSFCCHFFLFSLPVISFLCSLLLLKSPVCQDPTGCAGAMTSLEEACSRRTAVAVTAFTENK